MDLMVVPVGLVVVACCAWITLTHRRLRHWRQVVEARGLTSIEATGFLLGSRLRARAGDLCVSLGVGASDGGTRIEIGRPEGPLTGLTLWPEGPDTEAANQRTPEIEVGDATFDERFYISGPPAQVLALLDVGTRMELLSLADRSRLLVTPRWISADIIRGWGAFDEAVAGVLQDLLELAEKLYAPCDLPMELARHARTDPQPQVRLQNLLCLVREYGPHPLTPDALREACSDPSAEIRLRAAMELGAPGQGILLQLAEQWADNDTLAARAIYALGVRLPIERAEALLGGALRKRCTGTALACIERLGRGQRPALARLATVLVVEQGELAIAAARALGNTAATEAAAPLVAALARADVREAAAEALGRVGSTEVVLDLKQALERQSNEKGFVRAARQAIAQIQARASNASPGQISLAVAEVGQVSLADEGAGQVSLADLQSGQLSLSERGEVRPQPLPNGLTRSG